MGSMIFYTFGSLAVLFSLFVVFLRNPITSGLSLVASFFFISGVFVVLDAPFVGVIQILIYAGAILVLFLYVMMLLNLRQMEGIAQYDRFSRLGGILLLPAVGYFMLRGLRFVNLESASVPAEFGSVQSVAKALLGPGALVFELISVVLLAAIVGSVILAAKRREEDL